MVQNQMLSHTHVVDENMYQTDIANILAAGSLINGDKQAMRLTATNFRLFIRELPEEYRTVFNQQINLIKQTFEDIQAAETELVSYHFRLGKQLTELREWIDSLVESKQLSDGGWVRFVLETVKLPYTIRTAQKDMLLWKEWGHMEKEIVELAKSRRVTVTALYHLSSKGDDALGVAAKFLSAIHEAHNPQPEDEVIQVDGEPIEPPAPKVFANPLEKLTVAGAQQVAHVSQMIIASGLTDQQNERATNIIANNSVLSAPAVEAVLEIVRKGDEDAIEELEASGTVSMMMGEDAMDVVQVPINRIDEMGKSVLDQTMNYQRVTRGIQHAIDGAEKVTQAHKARAVASKSATVLERQFVVATSDDLYQLTDMETLIKDLVRSGHSVKMMIYTDKEENVSND